MWRVVRACLARVAATDDVVEFEDGLNAVLAFVAGRTPSWTLSKSWSNSRGRTSHEDGSSRGYKSARLEGRGGAHELEFRVWEMSKRKTRTLELMIRTQCHRR